MKYGKNIIMRIRDKILSLFKRHKNEDIVEFKYVYVRPSCRRCNMVTKDSKCKMKNQKLQDIKNCPNW